MIGVLDYGMGNLGSVSYALARIGARSVVVRTAREIEECSALVIPGVGSFNAAMQELEKLKPAIKWFASTGKPVLGICLGMQVLFERGSEGGSCRGLGLLEGSVRKMRFAPKLPHVGWNNVRAKRKNSLFKGIPNGACFYFVHSYACELARECVLGTTKYGKQFVSAAGKENVFGVQFHPEKSGAAGERLLKNFVELI